MFCYLQTPCLDKSITAAATNKMTHAIRTAAMNPAATNTTLWLQLRVLNLAWNIHVAQRNFLLIFPSKKVFPCHSFHFFHLTYRMMIQIDLPHIFSSPLDSNRVAREASGVAERSVKPQPKSGRPGQLRVGQLVIGTFWGFKSLRNWRVSGLLFLILFELAKLTGRLTEKDALQMTLFCKFLLYKRCLGIWTYQSPIFAPTNFQFWSFHARLRKRGRNRRRKPWESKNVWRNRTCFTLEMGVTP